MVPVTSIMVSILNTFQVKGTIGVLSQSASNCYNLKTILFKSRRKSLLIVLDTGRSAHICIKLAHYW